MKNEIKKRFCLVYDTFKEMITDPDIISDMVVMTLGHDTVDDGEGAIYRIVSKDSLNVKNIQGESFGYKSSLYALLISRLSTAELQAEIFENKQMIKSMNNVIIDIHRLLDNNILMANQIFRELYLDENETIKIVQTYDGRRYILNTNENLEYFEKQIPITNENSWIIPTEFVISDFTFKVKVLDDKVSVVKYEDNTLYFALFFDQSLIRLIPY